ncbi:ribosome biogenesis GTP-binding protein YihA/YsxC [uncultured Clostridium sp.]|uniref:ribosome biogenesis GTP-binding protein YihA/YsxC n=1 Tax=uncultured Clostridium sp. TaxID=59620 RepID=UPI00262572F3|nr:ribosome biogenesis GTP-binding protein YihA/YsxC [uncultured Clostridium sp.]
MKIKTAEFVTSAVKKSQYVETGLPEIAFVGRSNVGKSSIINALTNRRGLAKVSQTPGKTKLINFFLLNDDIHLVDLPGYGYAKVSKTEKETWGQTIENYLLERAPLKRVVLLLDCRRTPNEDDVLMYNWIKHYGYDCKIVSTKRDKISNNELFKAEKRIRDTMEMDKDEELLFFSSLNKKNKEEIIEKLFGDLYEF